MLDPYPRLTAPLSSTRRASTWSRLQQAAAARPPSTLIQTPSGGNLDVPH